MKEVEELPDPLENGGGVRDRKQLRFRSNTLMRERAGSSEFAMARLKQPKLIIVTNRCARFKQEPGTCQSWGHRQQSNCLHKNLSAPSLGTAIADVSKLIRVNIEMFHPS